MPVGTKNANCSDQRAGDPGDAFADGRNHHHVRAGRYLADAVDMDQLRIGEPMMDVGDQSLHLRERRHTAADGEQREIRKDAGYCRDLIHEWSSLECAPGLCGRKAKIDTAPTERSTTGTESLK